MTPSDHAKVLHTLIAASTDAKARGTEFHIFDKAIAIMRREPEPISDAEIYKLWPTTTNFTFKDELLKFSRRLIERAT